MTHVLVIEDDDGLRGVIIRALERWGYAVAAAENGVEGMRCARAATPDLVITDLRMPEQEGIETIQMLREEFPEVKILAISGAGGVEDGGPLLDALLLGADATLPKPFTLEALATAMEEALAAGS